MMPKALHIMLTNLIYESRLFKECYSLKNILNMETVAYGLHEKNLEIEELKNNFLHIKRFVLFSRRWSKIKPVQLIKYLECWIRMKHAAVISKPDIVHAHSLMALPIAVSIGKRLSIPVIYDAHEFETETQEYKNQLLKKIAIIIEGHYIKYTKTVINVSPSIASAYTKLYGIVPIIILNCPQYIHLAKSDLLREQYFIPQDHLIFLYQGGLLQGRGLGQLLEVFSELGNYPIDLVIMGYGPLMDIVLDFANRFSNIHYKEAVPMEDILKWTSSANIGVSIIEGVCLNYQYCLPNKLFEYCQAGLPVIVSNLPEMKNFVSAHKLGWIIDTADSNNLKNLVLEILNTDLTPYITNAKKTGQSYTWNYQEKKLVDIYRRLLANES